MNTCRCNTEFYFGSGGSPILPRDITDNYTVHFSYSNWDVYTIFTCKDCGTNWFFQSDYVDRPPYLNRAIKISSDQLANFKAIDSKELDKLIEIHGVRYVAELLRKLEDTSNEGNIAPDDN